MAIDFRSQSSASITDWRKAELISGRQEVNILNDLIESVI